MTAPADFLNAATDLADALLADLTDLVAIPSVTGSAAEPAAQEWVAERLADLGGRVHTWLTAATDLARQPDFPGMETEHPELRGAMARWPGPAGPSLLLLGHTDVVPAPGWEAAFTPQVTASHVTGRGTTDMKGGVACMLHAVRILTHLGIPLAGDLVVATVSAEEDGGAGTYDLLRRGITADRCVIAEPSGGAVVTANAGALGFQLTVTGRGAHAARRWEGVDALAVLETVRAALNRLERENSATADDVMAQWPVPFPTSIGVVRGGVWASTVMDHLVAAGRYGAPFGLSLAQSRARFEDTVAAAVREQHGTTATVSVEWVGGQFAPARVDPGAATPRAVAACHEAVTGVPAAFAGTTYGSDLRLTLAAGIESVIYGPGDARDAHTAGESVPIADLLRCSAVLAAVAAGQG